MSDNLMELLAASLGETLYMVVVAIAIACLLGIPLGIILTITRKDHILPNAPVHNILGAIVNAIRSVPFIILMVAIIPFTRLVAGTSIGTTAAIVPLTIAAIPYTARMVETSIREIPFGLIEAAESMGASPLQIIWKVLIPEALPSIIESLTVVIVSLIGASAMAGTIGGGGLGDLAIRYGYQRFQTDVMLVTVVLMLLLVQLLQSLGDRLVQHYSRK